MSTTHVNITAEAMQASQNIVRRPDPSIVVIFGASGDLTKRKLLPALYHLQQSGYLPEDFAVLGVARRDLSATFAPDMKDGVLKGGGVEAADQGMKDKLAEMDKKFNTKGNRLFYLAVAPEYFSDIIAFLGKHEMNK